MGEDYSDRDRRQSGSGDHPPFSSGFFPQIAEFRSNSTLSLTCSRRCGPLLPYVWWRKVGRRAYPIGRLLPAFASRQPRIRYHLACFPPPLRLQIGAMLRAITPLWHGRGYRFVSRRRPTDSGSQRADSAVDNTICPQAIAPHFSGDYPRNIRAITPLVFGRSPPA
jgi:hypothetical protein